MPITEKVLIVDDHPVVLDGLTIILSDVMSGAQIFKAIDGAQALTVVKNNVDIDWIFLDVNLPDIDGIDLIKAFKSLRITANIVVLSSDSSPSITDRALKQQANGFLSKSFVPSELTSCIKRIEQGKIFLLPPLQQQLTKYRDSVLVERQLIETHISNRQLQTLNLLANGYSNLEIADSLGIVESTVKSHIQALMSLFEADNRTHCAAEARRLNIIR